MLCFWKNVTESVYIRVLFVYMSMSKILRLLSNARRNAILSKSANVFPAFDQCFCPLIRQMWYFGIISMLFWIGICEIKSKRRKTRGLWA